MLCRGSYPSHWCGHRCGRTATVHICHRRRDGDRANPRTRLIAYAELQLSAGFAPGQQELVAAAEPVDGPHTRQLAATGDRFVVLDFPGLQLMGPAYTSAQFPAVRSWT